MPLDGGELLLLRRSGRTGFDVHYRRANLEPLLVDLPADDAETTVARLHALRSQAHRVAFSRALAVATGVVASPARQAAWSILVGVEQAEAMVRRVALDLPRATGSPPRAEEARPVFKAANSARAPVGLTATRGSLKPDMSGLTRALALLSNCFDNLVRDHETQDIPVVESPYSGVQMLIEDAWLATRAVADSLAAAVTEAAVLHDEDGWAGGGSGGAETVRGRLTTRIAAEDGIVRRLGWTSPTDRLFAGKGPGTILLNDWCSGAREFAVVMAALDPCVPWRALPAPVDA